MATNVGGRIKVKIQDDGSFKIDARQATGKAAEIEKFLKELAALAAGDPEALVVEAHVHGSAHDHDHDHDHATGHAHAH